MEKRIRLWATAAIVLALRGTAFGLATDRVGPDRPDRPTVEQDDWGKGVVELPRHPTRVYSRFSFTFGEDSTRADDLGIGKGGGK